MIDETQPPAGTFDDLESALSFGIVDAYLHFEAARCYGNGMKHQKSLQVDRDRHIVRALELGVPPKLFAGPAFRNLDLAPLMPAVLPSPIPTPKKAEVFLPPPFDLRQILAELP
jgi:hypothetical protein